MSVKERLIEFLRHERITQREFTDSIGVSPAYIGAMRRSITDDKVKRIRESYPELNTDWLLYGEGRMLNPTLSDDERTTEMVPLLPVSAMAGSLQDYSGAVMLHECELVPALVNGAELAIRVSGDSMEPKFCNGATLFLKKINDKAFIPWGHSLVIDTENGVLVKDIFPGSPEKEYFEARSINPSYPPISVPRESVFALYRILGSLQAYPTF